MLNSFICADRPRHAGLPGTIAGRERIVHDQDLAHVERKSNRRKRKGADRDG
jgi:hypothetical protein